MPKKTSLDMEGHNEDLRKLSLVAQQKVIVKALRSGMTIIKDEMARRAPRGETNRLANGMMVSVTERTPTSAVGKAGSTMFYGTFQETGTKHHRAQPFIEPALEATEEQAIDAIIEAFNEAIEEELG